MNLPFAASGRSPSRRPGVTPFQIQFQFKGEEPFAAQPQSANAAEKEKSADVHLYLSALGGSVARTLAYLRSDRVMLTH